ncbi:unnamed protein product [Symbiodinium sp. CCMP2592]|nr:unnamed protein product [Symbiodinium sp. CCMP2592]
MAGLGAQENQQLRKSTWSIVSHENTCSCTPIIHAKKVYRERPFCRHGMAVTVQHIRDGVPEMTSCHGVNATIMELMKTCWSTCADEQNRYELYQLEKVIVRVRKIGTRKSFKAQGIVAASPGFRLAKLLKCVRILRGGSFARTAIPG